MKFDIPTLYRNSNGRIDKPGNNYYGSNDDYDQYALLDLIEFIGQNCRDISIGNFHSYFGHNHIKLLDTNGVSDAFRNDINGIFQKTGLLYTLTKNMTVERVIEYPNETKDYEITVDFHKRPQLVISGTYDKNNLPEDWPEFAEGILDFMRFYGIGEILDPSVYKKAKRKTSDYIFCSVEFDEGSKSYYYLTEDDSLSIGDFVFVPVGKDGHTAIVEIVNIEYFPEDKAPFPLDKVKRIIRKCTEEDFNTSKADNQENESIELKINSILPFDRLVLCNEDTSRAKVNVWAELSEGCLKISGQDFGEAAQDVFGEDEYEYFYDFDRENTERLFALLDPERQNIKEMLLQKFGGIDGCRILREFCDANNIKYNFFSC